MLRTTDGGRTWTDLTPHRIWPAPWYWLALMGGLVLLIPAVAPPPAERIERSVAEVAVTDRPIGPDDPDPLGFDDIALGLSRFLRNTATRPPLTVAVTGEWGTGKSSLMNLLKADLERYGFRPVWFNAWHHQKEEQLLAALLENIRQQAVPSWLRPEGWSFRLRLLGRRLRRWFPLVLALVILFGLATGWVIARGEEGWSSLAGIGEALELLNPVYWFEQLTTPAEDSPRPAAFAWLAAALGVGYTLFRGLRAFGLKPAQLVTGLSSRAKIGDVQAQTGFRYRFSREFRDVTQALTPRTLTVLIDDLDRCRPQNVLDVLEAVNFLVSSGDCYVILGIDRERVERCVGYGFREVAEEILKQDVQDETSQEDPSHTGHARRAAFARQYLEKLINIEVPVPPPSKAAGLKLIRPGAPDAEPPNRWQRAKIWLETLMGRWWLLPALLPLALVLGLWVGSGQGDPTPNAPAQMVINQEPETVATTPANEGIGVPAPGIEEPPSTRASSSTVTVGFSAGEPGERPHLWLWTLSGFALLGVGIWVLTTVPEVEVHDSKEFVTALETWYPLLYEAQPTPRAMKRFLNRVRFYAMRQRSSESPRSRWQALLDRLSDLWPFGRDASPPEAPTTDGKDEALPIPEDVLVALGTLQQTHPEWLEDDLLWQEPRRFFAQHAEQVVPLSLMRPLEPFRPAFERLSRGIETR